MFWGTFSANIIKSLHHIEEKNGKVVDKNVLHSARTLKMHRGWAFPQNNDPKHTSKSKAQEDTR